MFGPISNTGEYSGNGQETASDIVLRVNTPAGARLVSSFQALADSV
jgi:hypothetical protein